MTAAPTIASDTTWHDRHGTAHRVDIDVVAARRLNDELGLDLLRCLTDAEHIYQIWQQLNGDTLQVVPVVGIIEDIPADEADAFARLFNGEALKQATEAVLFAIADFFPARPATVLRRLLVKTEQTATALSAKSEATALRLIDDLDFGLALNASPTPGSGSTVSSASRVPTAADLASNASSIDGRASPISTR